MKLYCHPQSGNSRRVLLTAAHLELSLEKVLVNLPEREQKGEPHLARNPNGRVPVLEDDGFLLWESRAIMIYLCDKTPGQELLPVEPRAKADVMRWLFWCANHMQPAAGILMLENFVKQITGRGPADPVEVARGEALFAQLCPVLDAHLAGKEWVAQERVTLADYSLAASFAAAGPARMPIQPYAHLRAWLSRVQELDAWKLTAAPPSAPAQPKAAEIPAPRQL
jgi:glutathione S-transferase